MKTSRVMDRFLVAAPDTSVNESIALAELLQTYHSVKHNISYSSMDCSIKLNKIILADGKTARGMQLGRTKMEAIVISVLGPFAIEQVITALQNDNIYFSLQIDASNRKNKKLFPVVVQYFTRENGIQTKLIDFYENSDESADGMFKAVEESLKNCKLSVQNISGLSADNCNANFGTHHSLYTNIKSINAELIKANCHAHIVHNAVRHSLEFLDVDIENIILKVYGHFSVSAVRRNNLKIIVELAEGEFREIKRHIVTRWLSLLPCVDTILLCYDSICEYFNSLGANCPSAIGKYFCSENIEIVNVYLLFCSHFLNILNKTIKCLEGNKVSIIDLFSIMSKLKNELENRINDGFFGAQTLNQLKKLEESRRQTIIDNFLNCLNKALSYISNRFDFSSNNNFGLLSKINLILPIDYSMFVDIIEKFNLSKLQIDLDELYSDTVTLKTILKKCSIDESFVLKCSAEKWSNIFQNAPLDSLQNLFKLISFLLSMPATSAYAERIFSVMNIKWRDERNRASIQLIKNELAIFFNFDLDCIESVNYFKGNKQLLSLVNKQGKYLFKN